MPAFVGLGAPHWEPDARGLISGMTLDTTADHIIRATLESIAYQTRDLVDAMRADGADAPQALRIDGGMAQNDWFSQFLSDIVEAPVERPESHETTALGAAYLAGLATGVWDGLDDLSAKWEAAGRFEPAMDNAQRDDLLGGWKQALKRALI